VIGEVDPFGANAGDRDRVACVPTCALRFFRVAPAQVWTEQTASTGY